MIQLELYKEVALTKDIASANLRKDDVATLLDIVPLSAIAPLRSDQMPAVRPLLAATA